MLLFFTSPFLLSIFLGNVLQEMQEIFFYLITGKRGPKQQNNFNIFKYWALNCGLKCGVFKYNPFNSEELVFVVFVMSQFYGFKNSRKGWKLPILWVFLNCWMLQREMDNGGQFSSVKGLAVAHPSLLDSICGCKRWNFAEFFFQKAFFFQLRGIRLRQL